MCVSCGSSLGAFDVVWGSVFCVRMCICVTGHNRDGVVHVYHICFCGHVLQKVLTCIVRSIFRFGRRWHQEFVVDDGCPQECSCVLCLCVFGVCVCVSCLVACVRVYVHTCFVCVRFGVSLLVCVSCVSRWLYAFVRVWCACEDVRSSVVTFIIVLFVV